MHQMTVTNLLYTGISACADQGHLMSTLEVSAMSALDSCVYVCGTGSVYICGKIDAKQWLRV